MMSSEPLCNQLWLVQCWKCPTKKCIRIGAMQGHAQMGRGIYSCLGEGFRSKEEGISWVAMYCLVFNKCLSLFEAITFLVKEVFVAYLLINTATTSNPEIILKSCSVFKNTNTIVLRSFLARIFYRHLVGVYIVS